MTTRSFPSTTWRGSRRTRGCAWSGPAMGDTRASCRAGAGTRGQTPSSGGSSRSTDDSGLALLVELHRRLAAGNVELAIELRTACDGDGARGDPATDDRTRAHFELVGDHQLADQRPGD